MHWSDMTQNWSLWFSRFKAQFPNLDDASMPFLKLDRGRFEGHLAETHDMTLNEAQDAVDGFCISRRWQTAGRLKRWTPDPDRLVTLS